MTALMNIVRIAQELFKKRLEGLLASPAGLTEEQYVRYLSMQHHLTKGVQRHFFVVASHPDLARRRSLRKFLVEFANEEELHFEIALKDLTNMKRTPLECPLDVTLWWAYFDSVVHTNPFVRLGATTVLENIAGPSRDVIKQLFARAKYVTEKNSRFFVIHQHDETLPHGDKILEALENAKLEKSHWEDVAKGARIATVMYLRMVDWALDTKTRPETEKFIQGLLAA